VPPRTQGTLLAGRYRVVRHLGSGGMASVLLCDDERLDRQVAIKRLHVASPGEMEQRFAREARLGASLNHPNLVAIYDTATDDEGVLIVMEYVEGESLAEALRRGPLEPVRVARMASELGDALDHAHVQGVVHRDVKPANVLLRNDGATKLADLGIAIAADQTRITRSGVVLGTAAYMAPEQLDGVEAGPASDVYALAAVCFEALTGEKARSGRTPMEIASAIATEPPPDLRDHLRAAPARAADILQRGLAREPGERPPSAGELGSELRRALERPAEPTLATRPIRPRAAAARTPQPAPARRMREPPRSSARPWVAVAIASAILTVAAATVALLAAGGGSQDDPAPRSAADTSERRIQQPQAEPSATQADAPATAPAETDPAPEETDPAPEETDPAPEEPTSESGPELNTRGFELLQAGRVEEAVPVLRRAVDSWPEDSRDIEYAYALFNLGRALRLSGDPEAAIPYLEKRLTFDDQRATVEAELERARQAAERL
jgi:serine/threonine-protein kinase